MVISSIDLKSGSVVQLKNGKDLVLKRDDADALIKEFDRFGKVAIIDLDAAMGNYLSDGTTKNTALLKSLLKKGCVRVGGGINDVKKAKELIALGAHKVIIGSAAWNKTPDLTHLSENSTKENLLDTAFLDALTKAIGKERIIISIDAINGKIAINGWQKDNGIPLEVGAKVASEYAGELLFTCVEKEGCMQGCNMDLVKKVRQATDIPLVVAGGVCSIKEIKDLQDMNCDVQLGMALYTGKIDLKEAFVECLNWQKQPLLPIIAQSTTGQVLMLGYANKEAIKKSFTTGKLTFFSRTRQTLWQKGETSGHYLTLHKMAADCDRDTILATVTPHGSVCHTGSFSCFTDEKEEESTWQRLYAVIKQRFLHPTPNSYTATLDDTRVREKIAEEAQELIEAQSKEDIIWEASDLLYFVTVLLVRGDITINDIMAQLDKRHKK